MGYTIQRPWRSSPWWGGELPPERREEPAGATRVSQPQGSNRRKPCPARNPAQAPGVTEQSGNRMRSRVTSQAFTQRLVVSAQVGGPGIVKERGRVRAGVGACLCCPVLAFLHFLTLIFPNDITLLRTWAPGIVIIFKDSENIVIYKKKNKNLRAPLREMATATVGLNLLFDVYTVLHS